LNKNKLQSLIILSLFLVTMFYFNPENILTDIPEEKQVNEQLNDSKPVDSVINTPTKSVIDYDTWYSDGPSIKTDIEFNVGGMAYDTLQKQNVVPGLSSDGWTGFGEELDSGAGTLSYSAYWSSSQSLTVASTHMTAKIYCGGSGTLTYNLQNSGGEFGVAYLSTGYTSSTFSVTSSMLDGEGYLNIHIHLQIADNSAQDWVKYTINRIDQDGPTVIVTDTENLGSTTSYALFDYMIFSLDAFYFVRDTITSNVKSTYNYASATTITHKVIVPSVPHALENNLYYNEDDWTYSSITPYASVTDSSGVLTINSPTELDYEVKFVSSCSNYLALEDVSSTYLTDVGFETGEYQNDWWYGSDTWETKEIATDIVSEGTYSLHLKRTADYDGLGLYSIEDGGTIENGYYYFSFDVYFVTNTGDPKMIFMQEGGSSWYSFDMSGYSTDMWHKIFIYSPILYSSSQACVVRLRINSGTVDMYLDNFKIFQTSTTIKTTQSSKSEISSTLISWDGYKNPSIPYADIELELWDRCDQILEESYSTTTDEFGVATWTLEKGLEQKEYEIRTYSLDNRFSDYWMTNYGYANDFDDNSDHWSFFAGAVDNPVYSAFDGNYNLQFDKRNTVTYGYVKMDFDDFTDISNLDELYGISRMKVEGDINNQYMYNYFRGNTDPNAGLHSNTASTHQTEDDGWQINIIGTGYDEPWSQDYCNTDMHFVFYLKEGGADTNTVYFTLDYVLLVEKSFFSPYYFTPSYPTEISDYATDELNDAWDFSEGDFDLPMITGSTANEVVENGYYYADCDTASYNTLLLSDSSLDVPIDCSYYTHLLFRAKMDDWVTGGNRWEFTAYDGGTPYDTEFYYTEHIYSSDAEYGEWVTWLVDLRTTTNFRAGYQWGVDFTTLDKIQVYHTGGQAHETTEDLWIDYIAFVHIDSWLEETNDYATDELLDAWDFEEGDEENTLPYSTAEHGCENGYGYFIADSDWDGYYFEDIETNSGYYNTLIFKIWADADVTGNQFYIDYRDDANANLGYGYGTALSTTWTVYEFTIDSSYVDDVDEIRFKFHSSFDDYNVEVRFDYVRLLHLEEMPYSVIQNSVLLESETNDYQYNLYLDHNLIGTFSDLSLIPLSTVAGTHYLSVQPFKTDGPYSTQQIFSYYYAVEADAFSVSLESFYLSDLYVNTYVTANRDGDYYVYTDNAPDGSGTLSAIGTTISTSRDLTVGVTINYAIRFVNDSSTIWFNSTYSNPSQAFFITDYRINTTAPNIVITWDTSKNTIDSLTAIEDGVTKVTDDPTSTTSWTKSIIVGTHYVTLIFSATNFDDIIYSFTYTVAAIKEFQVDVENVFPSDDFISIYVTSNYDYSYTVYTNESTTGSGNGLSAGTFIIIPKLREAGIFNLTVEFVYGAESVLFMTWYSNLIPPPEPSTDIYREQSEGFFNISFITNLDYFWIDIYHDNVLIVDDSTLTAFSIAKDTLIGWHNVSMVLIFNCSTDAEGYPVAEYNQTVTYPTFWYETVLFYDCQIRYTERIYGIAVPEINVDSVLTYLDGVLVDTLNYTSVIQDHSNYSYILNNRLWIHNSARNHRLVVKDLFDNLIYNVSIDIGIIQSMTIELPLEKLYVINIDDDDRLIKIRPYLSGLDWDADSDDLITMILGQYETKSYWLIDSTYECRIYKKVESSTSDGVTLWYWVHDPDTEPPPERVPMTVIIPLESSDDDDDGEKTWWDKVVNFFKQYWFYIAAVLLLIVLVITYNVIGNAIVKKQEKQIRQNKKVSLMVQTLLQLLWANKYERLKGYERGKKK